MLISNSAVHEIDVARWLLESEFTSVTVFKRRPPVPGALVDPQFIVLESRQGALVDIEVFVNAHYGYDVRAELVCEKGTLTLAPQSPVHIRSSGQESSMLAQDWRAHFSAAYRTQLQLGWTQSGPAFLSGRARGTAMPRPLLRLRVWRLSGAGRRLKCGFSRARISTRPSPAWDREPSQFETVACIPAFQ
jgi:hypothetical protein